MDAIAKAKESYFSRYNRYRDEVYGSLIADNNSKIASRTWESFLTGISTGILVYLFFDLMHEAVEQTAAKDPLSWLVFLGSFLIGFVGLVAFEQQQQGRNRSDASGLFPDPERAAERMRAFLTLAGVRD